VPLDMDVWDWLNRKLTQKLDFGGKIGAAGWALKSCPFIVTGIVFCSGGKKDQQTYWDGDESELGSGQYWWPCIVGVEPGRRMADLEKLPFYCPALAAGTSLPWWVHKSRVRRPPTAWKLAAAVRPARWHLDL